MNFQQIVSLIHEVAELIAQLTEKHSMEELEELMTVTDEQSVAALAAALEEVRDDLRDQLASI